MNTASLSEIKKELQLRSPKELTELCLRLAKYKKENKELLNYLLLEAGDEDNYISHVKAEVEEQFRMVNSTNVYYAKKSIRKALRMVNKYAKYSGQPVTGIELLIHFCLQIRKSGVNMNKSVTLSNLYGNQLKKIEKILSGLHEDLQYDYRKQAEDLL